MKNVNKPISSQSKLFNTAEKLHIQAHLALTELRLRFTKNENGKMQAKRGVVADTLHDYWKRGSFPLNTYRTNVRTPVFIDENGTHCAVGYLMAQTGYGDLAQAIDKSDKFVLVEQLNNREATSWLNKYGLSQKEAALIQPGYGGFIIERVSYSLQDKLLAAVSIIASLALIAFVVIALRVVRNRTITKPKKRNALVGFTISTAVIITGFIFYLPAPHRAVEALTYGATSKETITCNGWNTPKNERPSVCNEFEEKGSVPDWREVPCEGICLL